MGFDGIGFSRSSRFFGNNRYRSFRPEHILYKESSFPDHWPPSGCVPTYTTIFKSDLQLAVVIIVIRYFVSQPGSYGINLNRLRTRHLAHHIDVVYAAIDDGT